MIYVIGLHKFDIRKIDWKMRYKGRLNAEALVKGSEEPV